MKYQDDKMDFPRRTKNIFIIVDTSEKCDSYTIECLRQMLEEILVMIRDISSETKEDIITDIAVLEYSSEAKWMYNTPIDVEFFELKELKAGGPSLFGEACKELDSKLSITNGYMTNAGGHYPPLILLFSNTSSHDDYTLHLTKLKQNSWFRIAKKIGVLIGSNADIEMMSQFTGKPEAIIRTHQIKSFIKNIL